MLYVHVSKCSFHRDIILLDLHATRCVTSVALHPPIDKTVNVPALNIHTCYIPRIHRQRKRARCASKFLPAPSPFQLAVVATTISLFIQTHQLICPCTNYPILTSKFRFHR